MAELCTSASTARKLSSLLKGLASFASSGDARKSFSYILTIGIFSTYMVIDFMKVRCMRANYFEGKFKHI